VGILEWSVSGIECFLFHVWDDNVCEKASCPTLLFESELSTGSHKFVLYNLGSCQVGHPTLAAQSGLVCDSSFNSALWSGADVFTSVWLCSPMFMDLTGMVCRDIVVVCRDIVVITCSSRGILGKALWCHF